MKKLNKLLIIFISYFFAYFFLSTSNILAECSVPAGYDSNIEQYNKATDIFIGQIISKENSEIEKNIKIKTRVLKKYKGSFKKEDYLTVVTPSYNGEEIVGDENQDSVCGYSSNISNGDIVAFFVTNEGENITTYNFSGNKKFTTMVDAVKEMNILQVSTGNSVSGETSIIISDSCKIWFDGCNDCSRDIVGGEYSCTERICEKESHSFCSEVFVNSDKNNISEDKHIADMAIAKQNEVELQRKLKENQEKIDKNKKLLEDLKKKQDAVRAESEKTNRLESERARAKKSEENKRKLEEYKRKIIEANKARQRLLIQNSKNQYEINSVKDAGNLKSIDLEKEFSYSNKRENTIDSSKYLNKKIVYKKDDSASLSNKIFVIMLLAFLGAIIYYYIHKYKIYNLSKNKFIAKKAVDKISREDNDKKRNNKNHFLEIGRVGEKKDIKKVVEKSSFLKDFLKNRKKTKKVVKKDFSEAELNLTKKPAKKIIFGELNKEKNKNAISVGSKTEIPKKFSLTVRKKKKKSKKNKKRK